MTDLEMTKLCAEAIEVTHHIADVDGGEVWIKLLPQTKPPVLYAYRYDPLNDDAQAMALLKRLELFVSPPVSPVVGWLASDAVKAHVRNPDLNRAIVTCVAQMQANRPKGE